jgi:hypothetical protein
MKKDIVGWIVMIAVIALIVALVLYALDGIWL